MRRVKGTELKVGDTIEVWWQPHRDTITALEPYRGSLLSVFGEGAQVASFAINRTGMTIEPAQWYDVVTS